MFAQRTPDRRHLPGMAALSLAGGVDSAQRFVLRLNPGRANSDSRRDDLASLARPPPGSIRRP